MSSVSRLWKRIVWVLALMVFATVPAAAQQQRTLTFENVFGPLGLDPNGSGNAPLPTGFQGLSWSGFQWFNNTYTVPNYWMSTSSGSQGLAAVVGQVSRATAFDFVGAMFGSPYRDGLNLSIVGYRNNVAVYSQSLMLNAAPQYGMSPLTLNWINVTSIQFVSSGGIQNGLVNAVWGPQIDSEEFTLDNFTFRTTATPEPATLVLLGTGLLGLAAAARKRRKRA